MFFSLPFLKSILYNMKPYETSLVLPVSVPPVQWNSRATPFEGDSEKLPH
jgi:hypothetical protein